MDFKLTAAVIKAKKKIAKSDGLGNFQHASHSLCPIDEEKLWTENLMGVHSPIAILRALWFLTTKLMGKLLFIKIYIFERDAYIYM